MGCDALKEITIVIADGEKVTVQDCGNGDPKKDILFWALCGAGGGNFGVVVKMKLQFKSSNATKLWLEDILGGHMKIRKRWKTLWRRCKGFIRLLGQTTAPLIAPGCAILRRSTLVSGFLSAMMAIKPNSKNSSKEISSTKIYSSFVFKK
ncbi:hypothetical protein M441DRAFT_49540 [Trichoderma asperellum CBS 433.97]|uniref:FAD-binding PCMH-type domain-containing protein n=1 Tax=Trichoderma asperellum (strain ATCC 204424 / CBS 433.97 / NBRC 101777) TaxID=1042311 RepID=A0A2T3YZY5_TRIA4|nr:hypothetical protein M441DRAFT_49540 [Trichoderma asperellum CBS 433.97]PTB38064.1 hypothetical protein M441DRAFT_49540 [Trichoderma asperellum CBS 433.97]